MATAETTENLLASLVEVGSYPAMTAGQFKSMEKLFERLAIDDKDLLGRALMAIEALETKENSEHSKVDMPVPARPPPTLDQVRSLSLQLIMVAKWLKDHNPDQAELDDWVANMYTTDKATLLRRGLCVTVSPSLHRNLLAAEDGGGAERD
jgi:hypothetical protein